MVEPQDDNPLVLKAKEFATKAHEGSVRKNNSPYILHVQEVAELTAASGGSAEEVAAAWLHDTVEDTPITLEDIQRAFGDIIAETVHSLTDLPEFDALPLAERKAKQAERIGSESASARRIKLADQTANVRFVSVFEEDPDRQRTYIEGAKKIADACKEVSPWLYDQFLTAYQQGLKPSQA